MLPCSSFIFYYKMLTIPHSNIHPFVCVFSELIFLSFVLFLKFVEAVYFNGYFCGINFINYLFFLLLWVFVYIRFIKIDDLNIYLKEILIYYIAPKSVYFKFGKGSSFLDAIFRRNWLEFHRLYSISVFQPLFVCHILNGENVFPLNIGNRNFLQARYSF